MARTESARKTTYIELRQERTPLAALGTGSPYLRALCLLCVLLSFFSAQPAFAARNRVLLQLSNLQQWVDLSYKYNGQSNDGRRDTSSQKHTLEESYHVGIDYAILNKRLANGTFEIELGAEQGMGWTSSSYGGGFSNDYELEYMFDLTAFDRRPYVVTVNANQQYQMMNPPFVKSYTLLSNTFNSSLILRNRILPVTFGYHQNSNETSGLKADRTSEAESVFFVANHFIGDFSETSLSAGTSESRQTVVGKAPSSSSGYNFILNNRLNWGETKRDSLSSGYSFKKETGNVELQTENWYEEFEVWLGKALAVGGSYKYDDNETELQGRKQNSWDAWLRHRLYESVTTRYRYYETQSEYRSGDTGLWGHQLQLAYTKSLPANSNMGLTYNYKYAESDLNLSDQSIFVPEESMTLALTGNYLANTDVDTASVLVFTKTPFVTFTEGIDYRLDPVGRRTELVLLSGALSPGDTVYIAYSYRVNNSIEYATTTHIVGANLGLQNQRYLLSLRLGKTEQDLLSGSADVSPLQQQQFFQLGFDVNIDTLSGGTLFRYSDATLLKEMALETSLNWHRDMNQGVLNFRVSDVYLVSEEKEGFSGQESGDKEKRNSLQLTADYRKKLNRHLTYLLRSRVADVRGESDRNDVSLGYTLEARWYKFLALLEADVSWEFLEESRSREDSLKVTLRRFF